MKLEIIQKYNIDKLIDELDYSNLIKDEENEENEENEKCNNRYDESKLLNTGRYYTDDIIKCIECKTEVEMCCHQFIKYKNNYCCYDCLKVFENGKFNYLDVIYCITNDYNSKIKKQIRKLKNNLIFYFKYTDDDNNEYNHSVYLIENNDNNHSKYFDYNNRYFYFNLNNTQSVFSDEENKTKSLVFKLCDYKLNFELIKKIEECLKSGYNEYLLTLVK